MTHEEWFQKGEIYATGALDGEELNEFEAHLRAGCAVCEAYVRETRGTLMLLHSALVPMTPSPSIKTRLLDEISSEKVAPLVSPQPNLRRWRRMAGTIAAGIFGLVIGGAYYRFHYEPRHTTYTAVINLLRDPATRDHPLYGAGPTPQAKGRFLWNESGEGHIFATDLPAAPQGKMYAVWTIAQQSAPLYVGTIETDAKGQGGLHVNSPRGAKPVEVFAVTIEPVGTTAAPTGPMVLVSKPT